MTATAESRLAILLSLLDDNASEAALGEMENAQAESLRAKLKQLRDLPPEQDQIEDVLDDFDRFFRFAVQTLNLPSDSPLPIHGAGEAAAQSTTGEPVKSSRLKLFSPSDDPFADLNRLQAVQIARAVATEHPKTIAVVLSKLEQSHAAETMNALPEEIQYQVFALLKQDLDVAEELVTEIARATVLKGMVIEADEVEEPDNDQRMVDLLRKLPKKTRLRLIDELRQNDEETANRLQDLLYVFEDLLQYENRSVQKILGAIESRTLIVALQDADEAINKRIFENLSKRASLALQEEIELKPRSTDDEVTAARKAIAQTIAKLDQAGDLVTLNE